MLQMDLMIAVDGMPAHLAGTLGRPTWLLLKHEADWRWMANRDDSPWYPSMRLFRQARTGDWDSVVARVAHALDRFKPATRSAA
jgi:ADP-heptose:LPS heptosyltransferase